MQAHGLRAVLFSGGEPFLHPDFDEILAWAAKRFIVEVNSNGLLIDKELASTLSRYNLKSVQVSLDSPTPSHHDAMRGLGSHAAAMAAIEALAHAGVPTRISTVVTSANVHLLDEIAALANDMGATCSALPVVRAGRASKISDHAWRSEFIATALRRVSSSDSLTPTLGFDPLCQAQVGYVSVSHAGHLKPCNMREHFFDRTGGRLVESPEAAWWRGFLGETSMSLSVSLANAGSASEAIGAVHDDIDRPCALQLAVACSGSLWERQPGQHRQDDAIPT
jgi:sulfatase maturation enzyme AslB (radical SAM superfamily)